MGVRNKVPVWRTVASLVALFFIFAQFFLFLGGAFGEYETRSAAPGEPPSPLNINGFAYSLLAAAAILLWIYAAYVAGVSIDRD